jgi:hypothetical protein
MSISTVAYEWPLRLATSSTPSTLTGPVSGSGRPRTSRIKVNRDTTAPSAAASRGTRAAGQRQRDLLQQAPQPGGAALVPGRQPGHLLGERGDRACRVTAAEPAHLQHDFHRPPATGKIVQAAPVPVMHPAGDHPAAPAGQRGCPGPGHDPHLPARILDMLQVQASKLREQQDQQAGFRASEYVQHN